MTKEKAQDILQLLKKHYPHAKMILEWGNNFELLVAIILSAQCTDKKVNEVTAKVFPKYKQKRKEFVNEYEKYSRIVNSNEVSLSSSSDPELAEGKSRSNGMSFRLCSNNKDSGQARITEQELIQIVNFSRVPISELEQDIKSTGFYHNKAKNVRGAARTVLEKFHGILPRSITELITIPGVGRKTANVFLGNAYGIYEGIAVDTHVTKQSQLLGLTKDLPAGKAGKSPEKIEQDLMKLFPQKDWFALTYLLIEHGRNMRKKVADQIKCSDPKCILCSKM